MLMLGIQLALNNARAAAEAFMGHESPFVRTPKQGDSTNNQTKSNLAGSFYAAMKPKGAGLELMLGLFYGMILIWACSQQMWASIPFLLLLHVGFITSGIGSIKSVMGSSAPEASVLGEA